MPQDSSSPGTAPHRKYERLVEVARKLPRVVTVAAVLVASARHAKTAVAV